MSFGSGGGFGGSGGFGQNNSSTGFGGFGQNKTNTGFGGFGSNNTSNTTGTGLFGGSNNNTSGGFGGFGGNTNNTSTGFGGFGGNTTTTSSGLFGSNTATSGSGFGGFGSNTNANANTNTTGGFGNNASSSGLFGSQKPAFGGSGTTGTSLFGGGTATGFGSNTTSTTGFGGAAASTGFGANNQTNQGTGTTPFSEHTEKEGAGATQTNSKYQSITAMPNYSHWSFEELRVADYLQGRKTGNANGQAGAFGQSTGFGGFGGANNTANTGFGNTSGGMFGSNNAANTGFGTASNTGFGGGTAGNTSGSGLFGSKPATGGGLFGSAPASSAQQPGGLFGTSNSTNTGGFGNTSGGFGTGANTGGGLFGATNNQQKTGFGGTFNSSGTQGTGTFGGFGQNNSAPSGGLFGNNNQQSGGSLFGQNNAQGNSFGTLGQSNQNQTQNQSGGLFGNANQQPKPAGLFANSTNQIGGGLFGSTTNAQPNTGSGLFGNANNQTAGASLFGAKPATTGTGLFGQNNASNTNTGGGLFGGLGSNAQQNTGGLFANNNNQQKPLFGSLNAAANTNTAATGQGLFGGASNTGNTFGGSLFGNSQQSQQPNFNNSQQTITAPLTTSISATNPYGHEQLFQSLNATPTQSIGPLATPLSSSQKQRKPMPLPQHRLNPNAASRYITPQKRTGYGFSYSTYGTPGSGQVSPYNNSLAVVNSFGRSLGKSLSTSNLRNSFTAEDSVLVPGILSPSNRSLNNTSSMKKLHIDRSFETRRPLFGSDSNGSKNAATSSPGHLRKTVSFENDVPNGDSQTLNSISGALAPIDNDRTPPRRNGTAQNGTASKNDGNATGKELATISEDLSPSNSISGKKEDAAAARLRAKQMQQDQPLGDYWSTPSVDELKSMSSEQLKNVQLTVGRDGAGKVEFSKTDLNGFPFDKLVNNVVYMVVRQVSVYGETSDVTKPPRGKLLNVPSRITLENSWPRAQAGKLPVHEKKGPRFEKHIRRLKNVRNTDFVNYDSKEGLWIFKVEHFSTYGLDYEGQPKELDENDTSIWSDMPDSPTPSSKTPYLRSSSKQSLAVQALRDPVSPSLSSPDDTFDFKRGKKKTAPGGFDEDAGISDEELEFGDSQDDTQQSFLDERSVGSHQIDGHFEHAGFDDGYEDDHDMDMAGSFPEPSRTTEPSNLQADIAPINHPKSILKESRFSRPDLGTPAKAHFEMGADWTEQLQRTVSPKKQDRRTLRDNQLTILEERDTNTAIAPISNTLGQSLGTSIDLMNELFGHGKATNAKGKQMATSKGFEWPYNKRPKTHTDISGLDESDRSFLLSRKPHWTNDNTLLYGIRGNATKITEGPLVNINRTLISEHQDVRYAQYSAQTDLVPPTLGAQREITEIVTDSNGVPVAVPSADFDFKHIANQVDITNTSGKHENQVWELASVLFDDISGRLPKDLPGSEPEKLQKFGDRLRRQGLSEFWKRLVQADADEQAYNVASAEERALVHLSSNNLWDACDTLAKSGNFHLATIVSQIGSSATLRQEMRDQIEIWVQQNALAEFSEPLRAIYEILSGNTSYCEGKSDAGVENNWSGFNIGMRFNLDWRRVFGLRLWYGVVPDAPLETAVAEWLEDIESGVEAVLPIPWFLEKEGETRWKDPSPEGREDLLWGLLKLYLLQQDTDLNTPVEAEKIFEPQSTSGNPLNARLSFQLVQLLRAKGVAFPSSAADEQEGTNLEGEDSFISEALPMADALTNTYASSLLTPVVAKEHWIDAIWVLTHLSASTARSSAIQLVLTAHAAHISDDPSEGSFAALEKLHVPHEWIWAAKAQHANNVLHDPVKEVQFLLNAQRWDDAHKVLCTTVAPRAVIEQNYDSLRELLGGFTDPYNGGRGAPKDEVQDWKFGGQVYFDFIYLMDLARGGEEMESDRKGVVRRLVGALEALKKSKMQLEQRVAASEMARVVAERIIRGGAVEKARVLRLPLTEDAYLKHTRELTLGFFRAVVAGGR